MDEEWFVVKVLDCVVGDLSSVPDSSSISLCDCAMSKLFNLSVPQFSPGKMGIIPFPFFHPSLLQCLFSLLLVYHICGTRQTLTGVLKHYKTMNNNLAFHLIFHIPLLN